MRLLKESPKMQKKINYLIILLTTILMVGCADVETVSTTKEKTDQEVTVAKTTENDEKEETTTVEEKPVEEEPVAEETSTDTNKDLFQGYELIEVDGGDLSG
jgi:PBP1b-binding outer membrane lipoprotein LpoB